MAGAVGSSCWAGMMLVDVEVVDDQDTNRLRLGPWLLLASWAICLY